MNNTAQVNRLFSIVFDPEIQKRFERIMLILAGLVF